MMVMEDTARAVGPEWPERSGERRAEALLDGQGELLKD